MYMCSSIHPIYVIVHAYAVKVLVQYNVLCCMYEPLFCVHTKLTLVQSANFIIAKLSFSDFPY